MSNELVESKSFSMTDMEKMARTVIGGGLFGYKSQEEVLTLLLMADAEGTHPMQAMRRYHVINRRPSKRTDAILMDFQDLGGKIKWIKTGKDGKSAKAKFSWDEQEVEYEYTIEDAKRAYLVKDGGGWVKNPDAMLRARVISNGIRMLCPRAIVGVYTPEEVESFSPPQQEPARTQQADYSREPDDTPQRVNITPPKTPRKKGEQSDAYKELSSAFRTLPANKIDVADKMIRHACEKENVDTAPELDDLYIRQLTQEIKQLGE